MSDCGPACTTSAHDQSKFLRANQRIMYKEGSEELCEIGSHQILRISTIIIALIGLVIVSYITYHSVCEIPKLQKLSHAIKYLYCASIGATYLVLLLSLTISILCLASNNFVYSDIILEAALYFVSYISMLILLAILILRLYTTFRQSAYKLSTNHIIALTVLYSLNAVLLILVTMENAFVTFLYQGNRNEAALRSPWLFGW